MEDCRAATVKAMPTYGKKEWVPIYVVTNRSYIWIDAQNICDIKQKPEPLLSGTHDDWLRLVIDTGAPRRRTFLSLGWEMLDISDRLHIMVRIYIMSMHENTNSAKHVNNDSGVRCPETGRHRKSAGCKCLEGVLEGGQ